VTHSSSAVYCFFFFQAEDGIRDATVTGVQTCALPIYRRAEDVGPSATSLPKPAASSTSSARRWPTYKNVAATKARLRCPTTAEKIGRASCRERVRAWESRAGI